MGSGGGGVRRGGGGGGFWEVLDRWDRLFLYEMYENQHDPIAEAASTYLRS